MTDFARDADDELAAKRAARTAQVAAAKQAANPGPGSGGARAGQPSWADRAEVERVLVMFLTRVLKAQGGQALRMTDAIRTALRRLAHAPRPAPLGPVVEHSHADDLARIDQFLARPALPGGTEELAREAAQALPVPLDRAALYHLLQMPVLDAPTSRLESRLGAAPTPGAFDQPIFQAPPAAQEQAEKQATVARRWQGGTDEPHTFGPVYPQQLISGAQDLFGSSRPPRRPRLQAQESDAPDVAQWREAGVGTPAYQPPAFDPADLGLSFGGTMSSVIDQFPNGSAALGPQQRAQLDHLLIPSDPNPDIGLDIEIVGHTDTRGEGHFDNQTLSEQRAAAVRDYLIKKRGIPDFKIKSTGKGATEPRFPERTDADRARNRRVEVIVRMHPAQRRGHPSGRLSPP
jgi:outer membrane protein OmpA-like peptidoglycan-associated protein